MSMFRNRRYQEMPGLNTAALPDLIFTVLFFFMLVTHMRHVDAKVDVDTPQGYHLEKVAKHPSVINMLVTDDGRIQIDNNIVQLSDVANYISAERRKMHPGDARKMMINIKADRNAKMRTLNEIRQQLRGINALNVSYSATEPERTASDK